MQSFKGGFCLIFLSGALAYAEVETIPKGLVQLRPTRGGALVVDKSLARVEFYDEINGSIRKLASYDIASGKHHGNKKQRGDNRTPEGIYFFTEYKDKSTLLPKYGDGAFVMDYPNRFDEILSKSGSGIWLHGTDVELRIPNKFDSEGCVVVRNQVFQELKPRIQINHTPILIYNETPYVTSNDRSQMRRSLMDFLEKWRAAWEGKSLEDYMLAYSLDHFLSRGMNWNAWKAYKKVLNSQYEKISVAVNDMSVFYFHPYAYVDFVQKYASDAINDTGNKRLGLYYEGGNWKIVTEFFYKDVTAGQARDITGNLSESNLGTL